MVSENAPSQTAGIRYEPEERPSYPLSIGLGFQAALLVLPGIVLILTIIIVVGDQGEGYLSWALFAALFVNGLITALQASRFGRIGAGHILISVSAYSFIAVCIAALAQGGVALMSSLIIVSSLFQFALSTQLSLLRRIITPVVSGTVLMLIAATIMPIAFAMLADVPEGASSAAAPGIAAVTLGAFVALLLAVPKPVIAAYLIVNLGLVFVQGIKIIVQDGIDYRKAAVVGLAFWIGTGFHQQAIFADQLGETWGSLLGNGITTGGLVAIVLTVLMELTGPRRRRIETVLDIRVLPRLKAFLREQAEILSWDAAATERLFLVGEETLSSLAQRHEEAASDQLRRLRVVASGDGGVMELEFVAAIGEGNLEDQIALQREQTEAPDGHEISLRLLRHFASSVHHQQYHGMDVVTVRVKKSDD